MPSSIKSGVLVFGVTATAIGLNLSVMALGGTPETSAEAVVAPVASTAAIVEPEVVRVVVDVPLPSPATLGTQPADAVTSPASNQSASPAAPAAPLAAAPVVQPPVKATTTQPPKPAATPSSKAPKPIATTTTSTVAPTTAPEPAPTTTVPSTSAPTTAAPAAAPTTEYLSYTFDGVAEIIIALHDGDELEFWSAIPEDGWAYQVEKNSTDEVELKFRRTSGGEGEAKFQVKIKNGELVVKKER